MKFPCFERCIYLIIMLQWEKDRNTFLGWTGNLDYSTLRILLDYFDLTFKLFIIYMKKAREFLLVNEFVLIDWLNVAVTLNPVVWLTWIFLYCYAVVGSSGFGFVSFETDDAVERLVGEHYVSINGKQVLQFARAKYPFWHTFSPSIYLYEKTSTPIEKQSHRSFS